MSDTTATPSSAMPDEFDRTLGTLDGLPDVTRTSLATKQVIPTLGVGGARTFTVQTIRQRDIGDTVLITVVGATGGQRLVLPPSITAIIARQHDALTSTSRSQVARRVAHERKANGVRPVFTAAMRAKAIKTRKANAAKRRARRAAKGGAA